MKNVMMIVKRWWVLLMVCTLALSLTSCSTKKKASTQNYGCRPCDDATMGAFDVYVIPSKTAVGMYELRIIPVQVENGDIVKVTVANQSLTYKEMVPEVVINSSEEVFGGYLTEADLYTYNILAITPYSSQGTFLEQTPSKAAFCTLPVPGDVCNGYGY